MASTVALECILAPVYASDRLIMDWVRGQLIAERDLYRHVANPKIVIADLSDISMLTVDGADGLFFYWLPKRVEAGLQSGVMSPYLDILRTCHAVARDFRYPLLGYERTVNANPIRMGEFAYQDYLKEKAQTKSA